MRPPVDRSHRHHHRLPVVRVRSLRLHPVHRLPARGRPFSRHAAAAPAAAVPVSVNPPARGKPGRAPEDVSVLPQDMRGAAMPKKSPATTPEALHAVDKTKGMLGKLDEALKKSAAEAKAAGKPVKDLNVQKAQEFIKAHAGDWPGFRKLTPDELAVAAVQAQGIKPTLSQVNQATRVTGRTPPPLPAKVMNSPAAKALRGKASQALDNLLKKNPKLAKGLDKTEAATYLRNSAGRKGNPSPEQLATEALLAQNKKVNVRQLDKAGITRAQRKGLLDKANAKVDNLDVASEHALKGVVRGAQEHLNALDKARGLLSMRGRASSFTPTKGEAFGNVAAKGDKPGITPVGESPPITRHMVEGDVAHLQAVMRESKFTPSQNYVHYQKVNQYVQDMLNGKFNWKDPKLGQKGNVVEIGPGKTIQHGHHRVVAAEIVSQLTGPPRDWWY